MRTGAEAFGLGVTQVSFVECIEKICKKDKSAIHDLMMDDTISMERVNHHMRSIG